MVEPASQDDDGSAPLWCARCGRRCLPGKGDFYVVNIEATADPTPAPITDDDLQADLESQMHELIELMGGMSERELMDQVYRRLTIFLCGSCYADWIENPAG